MKPRTALEYHWPYLLTTLPQQVDIEETAFSSGALRRRRGVDSAEALLRLALVYGVCGFSLRQTAAWAEVAGVASLSDVALLKRLRGSADWLGYLLGQKLAERAEFHLRLPSERRIRLVDATSVSQPGGAEYWRVHLAMSLHSLATDDIEVTNRHGGERLTRFRFSPDELVVADRGYAHRAGFAHVAASGAKFLVRINWQNVPLESETGEPFDILAAARQAPEGGAASTRVLVSADREKGIPALEARLVVVRKSEPAAERARRIAVKAATQKRRQPDARTLEAASYTFLLTDDFDLDDWTLCEIYRFRWQIELAFKELKGLLDLGELPAKDPPLVRAILYAKLLAALMLDDLTESYLAFSPWGFRYRGPPPLSLATQEGPP